MRGQGDEEVKRGGVRKQSLLDKLNVPIDHVDYAYVTKCSDPKELEKVLRVLRSGEEGYYPDLDTFVCARLEIINPKSRYLRVEVPILRPDSLETGERVRLETDLSGWVSEIGENQNEIFTDSKEFSIVPIRGSGTMSKIEATTKPVVKTPNPDRIKAWEYDKWDKFDVDTELMKLDIGGMQAEEKERIERLRQETPKLVPTPKSNSNSQANSKPNLTKNEPKPRVTENSSQKPCCSKSLAKEKLQESWFEPKAQPIGPSFIEEVAEEPVVAPAPKSKRRVKIFIDDIHLG